MAEPFLYSWNGMVMTPLRRFASLCAKEFQTDCIYRLKEDEQRSPESHGHYFSCVHAAFANLPEAIADRFANEEHLRKWCLIKTGYRHERTYVATSSREATEIAAFISPMDEYAVIVVEGNVVTALTAKTQKLRRANGDGMDKAEFESSKEAVLRVCSELIGVDVVTLLTHESPSIAPNKPTCQIAPAKAKVRA